MSTSIEANSAAPIRREPTVNLCTPSPHAQAHAAFEKGLAADSRVPAPRDHDHVEFSAAARAYPFALTSDKAEDFRGELVRSVRDLIANGTYENADKLSAATDALLASL